MYKKIRKELSEYYHGMMAESAAKATEKVYAVMDAYDAENPNLSSYKLKSKLYDAIVDAAKPVIFKDIPFYFEAGMLHPRGDGKFNRSMNHANGWLYLRNCHLFTDIDPHARMIFSGGMYLQSGIYADMMHLQLPFEKVFKIGLSGILSELRDAKNRCTDETQVEFIDCCTAGINALCKMSKKFAVALKEVGCDELSEIANRIPIYPPKTLHEGLCTLAFMRKSLGILEGMGFSSFGRVDVLLAPLYENDLKNGVTTDEMLNLVTKFLLVQDCLFKREAVISDAYEQELENTLTLGGCDSEGNPVFNGVTRLFLKARENEDIIYPKMMLRFSQKSPREYLKLIFEPLMQGKSFSLYSNDDSIIPALIRSGIDREDALNYSVGGCWDILTGDVSIHNSGEYVDILKPLQWSIHNNTSLMRKHEIYFESLEECKSFEELYVRYIGFLRRMFMHKHMIISRGTRVWHEVNPVGALSALMKPCIENLKDITNNGGKYNRETAYLMFFADAVDSLLAIKHLCFDKKACTVSELFNQCRLEWQNEELRLMSTNAPSYGDGSEESISLVKRLIDDIYDITRDLPMAQQGELRLGSHLYTEILFNADSVPAMPNGRRRGDYLSQGFSPSRLQRTISVSELLYTLQQLDMSKFACSTSITLTLPAGKLDIDNIVALFLAAAQSGIQAIQPNIVNRDELIEARKNPENYRHIIVRVCGFSAPFVNLSDEYQDEFLSRMMIEV
ncbi:MAG: hypothetical protein E7399_00130 [Ruminococcaceae bacterium]|nr:hypothetical protein [Oscillospiraceae bacterium]